MVDVVVHSAVVNLTQAVERFDKSSTELVSTTNKLTKRILTLTYVVIGLGVIQLVTTVVGLCTASR